MQPTPNRLGERVMLRIDPAKKKAFLQMLQLFDFVEVETLDKQVGRYVQNAPKDVPITDDDIMQEVLAVRSRKKTGINVAFDANIWISFTIGKHLGILSHILLDETYSEVLNIHGCPEILFEYMAVVKRPKLRKYMKPERVQETLDLIARVTESHYLTRVVSGSRDLKDNYLLALAETVPLDYLVTGDRDLLVLEHWEQTQIILFAEFVKLIGPAIQPNE